MINVVYMKKYIIGFLIGSFVVPSIGYMATSIRFTSLKKCQVAYNKLLHTKAEDTVETKLDIIKEHERVKELVSKLYPKQRRDETRLTAAIDKYNDYLKQFKYNIRITKPEYKALQGVTEELRLIQWQLTDVRLVETELDFLKSKNFSIKMSEKSKEFLRLNGIYTTL